MLDSYRIEDTSQIISPALVVYPEVIKRNLARMIAIAGGTHRLRPHCKTHKMAAVTEIELAMGITKHKCATFAEAEMLALAGVEDILLAYNLVGPNIARAVEFRRSFPDARLIVMGDHPRPIEQLAGAMADADTDVEVMLDLDIGQHRTGIAPGPDALALYRQIAASNSLRPGGLHLYDGHNHQTDLSERTAAVDGCWQTGSAFRDELLADGLQVPRIVAGGTGSFPIFASYEDAMLELSPGTCVLHDAGYDRDFPDMDFDAAAMILTRVVSRPTPERVTVDLGTKACASDPPAGKRLAFPALDDAREVLQNEEHLVLETSAAGSLEPGDELLAIPIHICPTSALHKEAFVIEKGHLVDRWPISARDRWLTI